MLDFINCYNLNNLFESVKWDYNNLNKKLSVTFKSPDKSSLGIVLLKDIDLDTNDFSIGVYDTTKLKDLLNVFKDDEINIDFLMQNNSYTKINLYDDKDIFNVKYNLADLTIIPAGGAIKQKPNYDLVTECDFSTDFLNAHKAIKSQNFMINSTKSTIKFIMFEDSDPTSNFKGNQIDITCKLLDTDENNNLLKDLYFDTSIFKSILLANNFKNAKCTLSISNDGILKLEFSSDDFNNVYYLLVKSLGN